MTAYNSNGSEFRTWNAFVSENCSRTQTT